MNRSLVSRVSRSLLPCLLLLGLFFVIGADAFAQTTGPEIPDLGPDLNIKLLVGQAITVIATAVGACVAAYFAFLAVKIALRYAGKMGG